MLLYQPCYLSVSSSSAATNVLSPRPMSRRFTLFVCCVCVVAFPARGKTDRESRRNSKIVKLWRKSCSKPQNQRLTCHRHTINARFRNSARPELRLLGLLIFFGLRFEHL